MTDSQKIKSLVMVLRPGRTQWERWWRQCSKGARSFRGQNLLKPGHPDALVFLKKVDDPQNTKTTNAAEIVSLSK